MAPPRTYRCEALTLRKSPIGEADVVVTMFTKDRGKLRAVAKGARRTSSKMLGHLEPMTQIRLSLARGRNLDYITQVQVINMFADLKNNLEAITKGLYLAELVDGFGSEASSNQPLYQLVVETLESIGQESESEWPLRYFELQLLQFSGLMPELYQCVECRQPLSAGSHKFSTALGGTLCLNCQPAEAQTWTLSLRALKVLRLLHRGPLPTIMALQADSTLAHELKSVLGGTVRYWLDKEIRSNSFLEQLGRESKTEAYT